MVLTKFDVILTSTSISNSLIVSNIKCLRNVHIYKCPLLHNSRFYIINFKVKTHGKIIKISFNTCLTTLVFIDFIHVIK